MKAAIIWLQEKGKSDNSRLNFLPRNWTNGIMPNEQMTFIYEKEEYIFQYTNNLDVFEIHRKFFERISQSHGKILECDDDKIYFELDESILNAQITESAGAITVNLGNGDISFKIKPRFVDPNEIIIEGGLSAPMPGKILNIKAKKNKKVKKGDTLLTLEAMKMEHSIKAYADGIVTDIFVKVGEQVENGSLLMKIN
jgi:propionyl-CoA carboxylase alpha chain